MAHVLSGERSLEEIIVESPHGVQVVPGASGVADLANLSAAGHLNLVQAFSSLSNRVDTMIVDTSAGISHSVVQFTQASQHVVLVVCDEPASMTDAYALVKVLSRNHNVTRFQVLANMVRSPGDGEILFEKLHRVTSKFLEVTLEYVGEIPEDPYLRRAIREQRPVVGAFPSSPSTRAFKKLALKADKWPVPDGPRGNLEFFVERLVQRPERRLEVVR
jgi:flagellar biosynthesis protein FlhG